jgi:hypothetical protein
LALKIRRLFPWKKRRNIVSIKTLIAASDIVKKLRNGQDMRDLMRKTNLVMMAEPEKFVGTEKGRNPVQFELTPNGLIDFSYDS